ncbi:TetR/AcrR family transcriptional regulator [Streptomyces sp. NPDC057474]|uniref:TetR/AcrR family transcriptional regulator n=1 Tax=Streptomyces sp. NPDC057474 TaxID=3346144 RepID=UPI0036BD60B3
MATGSKRSEQAKPSYGEGRQALVRAAIRLVARDGLAKLTYRSLTAEAGVSQGSLRHHFPNLNAVLEASLELCLETTQSYLRKPSGSFEDLFAHLATSLREHPEIPAFQTEVFVGARHEPDLKELALRHQEAYRERTRTALADAGLPYDEDLVEILVAIAEGIVYQRVVFGADRAHATDRQIAGSRRLLSALTAALTEPAGHQGG